MLPLMHFRSEWDSDWQPVAAGGTVGGLHEDAKYILTTPGERGQRVFIDDVELQSNARGQFNWCPNFYAGRVAVEVVEVDGSAGHCWLDVSPSPLKSGDDHFKEMVRAIHSFDPALLLGVAGATSRFGRDGAASGYADHILLARVRQYGPTFLRAMEEISRSPHRSLTVALDVLPLSRVRRLHPGALRDRRLAQFALGVDALNEDVQSIRLRSLSPVPTVETPANRAVVALLKRFLARVMYLKARVSDAGLAGPEAEQRVRMGRRALALHVLEVRAVRLLSRTFFGQISRPETTAAGLTQVSAHPLYSRAHRNGVQALATGVEGGDRVDALHVPPSWGIYELWCYLSVIEQAQAIARVQLHPVDARAASAKLAYGAWLEDGRYLEVLFQAKFPAGKKSSAKHRRAWSITGERVPDILLVLHRGDEVQASILDAKWRAQRHNILDAMESAHIYHDALRLQTAATASTRPSPCMLLLPSSSQVPSIEAVEFIEANGVGAAAHYCFNGQGPATVSDHLARWLGMSLEPPCATQI